MILEKQDFARLFTTAMEWQGYERDWLDKIKEGRFEPKPSMKWKWAYWFETYDSALWAKQYLINNEITFELVSDEYIGDWVILTDLAVTE